jgi:ethanolamine kinase
MNGISKTTAAPDSHVKYIPLTYSPQDSHTSATRLILLLFPSWGQTGSIEFVRFTDGITNTLLKAVHHTEGSTPESRDTDAVLLRAYGKGTDLIIDRERETQNHELLSSFGLAPELLARFHNGMIYRYIPGRVTSPADLRNPDIYRAVAKRLAEWHARVPCLPGVFTHPEHEERSEALEAASPAPTRDLAREDRINHVAPGKVAPNVWTVMQKWIYALPANTEAECQRQAELQAELLRTIGELAERPGLGKDSLVFAHCDLLSGNVIVQPESEAQGVKAGDAEETVVSFIDYEYAVPSPAAFDLANHFAEWGGFDCDFSVLPTRAQRRDFIGHYIKAYYSYFPDQADKSAEELEQETEKLAKEVDVYRGVPGLYWGVWAIIQSMISQIDFDYAGYAEIRLGEYFAWRAEEDGSRVKGAKEMPLRERRWAQEE